MKSFSGYFLAVGILFSVNVFAQQMPQVQTKVYPFINTAGNRITNSNALDSFYKKLQVLKQTGEGTVSIVHIGDSHLQAGSLTAIVRNGLQAFFGNAGRGIVFPYQLAKSNAPEDVASSSNIQWRFNRVAHPELPGNSGIAGFYISTNDDKARINLGLKGDSTTDFSFSTIKLFMDTAHSWLLHGADSKDYLISGKLKENELYQQVDLNVPATYFSLNYVSGNDSEKIFYGASLENYKPGVLYHSIGVNGAKYDSYSNAPLFMQQIPALKADLYIISMGTNEAQALKIDADAFTASVQSFVNKLLIASPGAAVLITTPADSYFNGRMLSKPMNDLNKILKSAASSSGYALWDLYGFTGRYGSSRSWMSAGLMSHDKIHYNKAGYELQGKLLLSALSKGYNDFISKSSNLYDLLKKE